MPVISATSIASAQKCNELFALVSNSASAILDQVPPYVCMQKITQPNGNFQLLYLDADDEVVATIQVTYSGPDSYLLCLTLGPVVVVDAILTEDDQILLTEDNQPLLLEA
jgi:hypothetical protein